MDIYCLMTQETLDLIARHCPDAMSTYIQCANRADDNGTSFFYKDLVEIDMSGKWSIFKSQIKKLALENLLEWHPHENGISVTLADQMVEYDD